jgi:chemotaxis protein methyltransferase CheR
VPSPQRQARPPPDPGQRRPSDAAGAGDLPPAPPALGARDFARLSAFIEQRYGIRMPPSKRTLLEARLGRRVHELGMSGFSQYCDHVLGGHSAGELVHMVDRVTTNKTDFFREPQHFDYLARAALPTLAEQHGAGVSRELRVWSAACSTGEEPYTLAMVLSEALGQAGRFQILATDLSSRVLRHAAEAVYPEALVQPVPLPLRRRYLVRSVADESLVRVRRTLRERVRLRQLNLLDQDYRIGTPQDVVFCRNVFIYFERRLQAEILRHFARTMVGGGFLFLGHSETINGLDVPFDAVAPTVYRRRAGQGG